MAEIVWTPDTVMLGDIKLWRRNPKKMSRQRADRLLAYWNEVGQFQTLAIGPENECYDGHQRINTLRAADFSPNHSLHVMRSSRALTEKEREELVIASSVGTTGQLDFDELSGWDVGDLMEWGLDKELLTELNSDAMNVRMMLEVEEVSFADAMGNLPDGEKSPFQQMTFTLHDSQAETVQQAMAVSKSLGSYGDTGNENSNANALARICELFVGDHDHGQG